VIERLLENWLDNCSERSLQFAFCQILIDDGHTVLHSSRHAPIEHGKDIITVDGSGEPCAFQLKVTGGKKLTKNVLSALMTQLTELVTAKIEHPSLKSGKWHQSFLVLNGDLEEEATDLLTKFNEGWVSKGFPENQVRTIVRGELLDRAIAITGRLFPAELVLFKLLLELYLEPGNGMIPKDKYATLIRDSLPMLGIVAENTSVAKSVRAVTATAIINTLALSSFSEKNNSFAEIEAWVLYVSHVAAVIDRFGFDDQQLNNSIELVEYHIYSLLDQLVAETSQNPSAIEGDPLTDQMFYRVRVTLLCGLIGTYSLWNRFLGIDDDKEQFCRQFVQDNIKKAVLWGEAAVPQYLSTFWYLKRTDATPKPDFLIAGLLEAICNRNSSKSQIGLPNPYYDAESVVLAASGLPEAKIDDTFNEHAFTAEALLHLFVRRNWKQHSKFLWPGFTRLMCCTIEFDEGWLRYLWRVDDQGVNQSTRPELTKDWSTLKEEAFESSGVNLPSTLKKYPLLFLLFLIVYPHRCDSESVRWLDSTLQEIA